jgi:hypothetical protein
MDWREIENRHSISHNQARVWGVRPEGTHQDFTHHAN